MTATMPHIVAQKPPSLPLAPRRGPLRLELLGPAARSAAMPLWREVEASLSNRRLMCSSVWTDTWLSHYGALVPHRFAIARRDGKPCGMALLTSGVGQHAGPFPLRTWHVGTAGEPDADSVCVEYNSLLVRNEDRLDFARQLVAWIDSQSDCDETHLDGFASGDIAPLLADNPKGLVTRRPSRYFDLRAARQANVEPMVLLGRRTRASLRRSMRQLDQPSGEWASSAERAEEMLHQLIERHQARWIALGQRGAYASRRFREFHFDLVHRLVPIGAMGLYRVTSPSGVLGCSQVFLDDNRALLYQSGWSPQSGDVSSGLVVDYLCLAECQRRGLDQFDFLAGDSDYKRRLSTHEAELAWTVWRRPRLKFAVLDTLRQIKRVFSRVEECLSGTQSPVASDPAAD
ncbi:MAG: GNAT family N-acetyltransferase [Planctomycetota bacterium]